MNGKMTKVPFHFYTSSLLVEITGKKAHHLKDFVKILKEIDDSSIFYHVHSAFRNYSFAPGQYSNDFARWVAEDLEESVLAERLAAISIPDFTRISDLRDRIVEIIENHLNSAYEISKAPLGREFYFLRAVDVISPTRYEANDLDEFCECLKKVGMRSLYFHFFDARLRLERKTNDFSNWLRDSLGDAEKAAALDALDPYFMSLDQLRDRIVAICQGEKENKVLSYLLELPGEVAHDIATFSGRIFRFIFRWMNE